MLRFRLRTLLIVLAVWPPLLAGLYLYGSRDLIDFLAALIILLAAAVVLLVRQSGL